MRSRQEHELNDQTIKQALIGLGIELGSGVAHSLVLMGGAAGLLLGLLPGIVTTSDVDAIFFQPPNAVDEILSAANRVADRQGLERGWLNVDAGLYAQALPRDWEQRLSKVGGFGRLTVYAISRRDLIAMKFYAHRSVDLEHLASLQVTGEELQFTKSHLRRLREKLPDEGSKIDLALYYVEHWNDAA